MKKLAHLVAICFLLSACNAIKQRYDVILKCGSDKMIKLTPSQKTYKCCIKIIQACPTIDSIQIYMDDFAIKGFHFKSNDAGYKICQDWYSAQLGIEIICDKSLSENSNIDDILLQVEFFN